MISYFSELDRDLHLLPSMPPLSILSTYLYFTPILPEFAPDTHICLPTPFILMVRVENTKMCSSSEYLRCCRGEACRYMPTGKNVGDITIISQLFIEISIGEEDYLYFSDGGAMYYDMVENIPARD